MKQQWMNIACQKAVGGEKAASCCHSRMSLSGIQNRALRWISGIDVALSGYPPKTCGYDKKGFGLAEVFGFRILHENS